MKKLILSLAMVGAVSLVGCNKDRTDTMKERVGDTTDSLKEGADRAADRTTSAVDNAAEDTRNAFNTDRDSDTVGTTSSGTTGTGTAATDSGTTSGTTGTAATDTTTGTSGTGTSMSGETTDTTTTAQSGTMAAPDKTQIREVQSQLSSLGYDAGSADGVMGDKTRGALQAFQRAEGLSVTGQPDAQTMGKIKERSEAHMAE